MKMLRILFIVLFLSLLSCRATKNRGTSYKVRTHRINPLSVLFISNPELKYKYYKKNLSKGNDKDKNK